jgi:hypothetical protein
MRTENFQLWYIFFAALKNVLANFKFFFRNNFKKSTFATSKFTNHFMFSENENGLYS